MSSNVRFTDFKSDKQPTWCPGCGDFGTMNGIMKALANSGTDPDNTFMVAGIGCSGKIGTYMHSYAIHGVHGRSLPVAAGVKLANPDLTVVVAGGDGDGYSIGAGHFIHAVRRNVDMAYTVMDNRIYGLTKGQASPTSREDFETSTTPEGPQQPPVNPLALSLAAGAHVHRAVVRHGRTAPRRDRPGGRRTRRLRLRERLLTVCHVQRRGHLRLLPRRHRRPRDTDHDPADRDRPKTRFSTRRRSTGRPVSGRRLRPFEEREGVEGSMAEIPDGAPDDAMDLVREFY